MMSTLEIQRLACLSTAHLSADVARQLDAVVAGIVPIAGGGATWHGLIVAERWHDYGWWVWVGSDGRDQMPETLRACLDAAEAAGADWLQFDRDCEPIAALPTHDW